MKRRAPSLLLLACWLGGCAAVTPEARVNHDPWEPLNRQLYAVNEGVDKVTLKPVARGYRKVVPDPVRRGITNFNRNLFGPASALNNALQGKADHAMTELGRFLINSTLGIGGLIDVAGAGGFEPHVEDFGQTAAAWGVPDGPLVMLPLLGPRTLRDATLLPLDLWSNPLRHYEVSPVRDRLQVLRIVNLRAQLLAVETMLRDSPDPYVTLRESYLQNRRFEVYDGNPPDDDDFYDEFLEDEDY